LINRGVIIKKKHKNDNVFTKSYNYIEDVSLFYNNKLIHHQNYIFIEKNETKNEQVKFVSDTKKTIPFAGYLGFDFFEKKILSIDYISRKLIFYNSNFKFKDTITVDIEISKRAILLNSIFENNKLICLFDTASSNFDLIIENDLYKSIFGKINKYEIVIRPDFIFRLYYFIVLFFNLKILNIDINKKSTKVYTVSKKLNNYYFSHNKHNAIIGNITFTNKILYLDLVNFKAAIL
jgi:hypothetical protein